MQSTQATSVTYTKVVFRATPTSVVTQTTEDTHTLQATATPTILAATIPMIMATAIHTLPATAIPTAATNPMIMVTEAIITIITITTHTNVKMDKELEDARKKVGHRTGITYHFNQLFLGQKSDL